MKNIIQIILIIHIFSGAIALISGAIAIATQKGKVKHKKSGKIYAMAMLIVFVTGISIASYQFNRFLFLIAFLSYYSVFSGVRILELKKLHQGQNPQWYDWFAGIINFIANLAFVAIAIHYALKPETNVAGVLLSAGFGLGGMYLSYVNMKPFVKRPTHVAHWYTYHLGNMMGAYIATFTAFLSTMVTRFELMNPFIAFALPSLIGIPLLVYWTHKTEVKFKMK
ncbi:hypothetical protein [Marivirga arenosa]|uniref:DUF2306 domain-containing protein n=1 Tax=Marivirga arenosa TaxID=3059076 RepID=A0AA49JCN6_9BACT|nr:hypothetical protein [Marivirga sp. BKB1-2]WKK80960.1 hypothetical protein QYS47_00670 [Marivirga sp. BKB1-2]